MFLIECGLVAFAVLAAIALPIEKWTSLESSLLSFELRFSRLAQKRQLAVLIVGASALLVRAALLPVIPIPQPAITDEFSYLLTADTFAHGRITNPTHPMWVRFESFYIIQKPTYCSAFFPAAGLFLALGQLIGGHPFWGVWLSNGLMCAAICWMLQAWLPPRWALLGGLLAVIRLSTFSYWANGYDGGAVAALGGALVLGALPRIRRNQRVLDALLMGLGFALLANSRPYEGLFLSLPVCIALLFWIFSEKAPPVKVTIQRTVLPLSLVLVATAAAMAYYFWRTTGSPFDTPYMVNANRYFVVPNFPWSPLSVVPKYNHPLMERFYRWPLGAYDAARSHPLLIALAKAIGVAFFFLGPLLTLPILMLGIVLPRDLSYRDLGSRVRFLTTVCATTFAGMLLPIYFNPHYAGPMTCAIYALVLLAMRRVGRWHHRGRRVGAAIVRAVPLVCVLLLVLRVAAGPLHLPREEGLPASWWRVGPQNLERARILSDLEHKSGHHLVIVRYSPTHYVNVEWVYNDADIDGSKVVWARDMGAANAELIHYFRDRNVWLLEPDYNPPRLTPYVQ